MSEIKSAGIKGYALMAAAIGLLLFVILVVYLYKYNNNFVPEKPELYGDVFRAAVRRLVA